MTKAEVAEIMVKTKDSFQKWKEIDKAEFAQMIVTWSECLEDVPYEFGRKGMIDYIKDNQYPPTIYDIRKPYKVFLEQQEVLKREYNNIYYSAIAYYPAYKDSREERIEFDRITKNSVGKAAKLSNMIVSFVREQEKGRCEFPTLEEWLKGIDSID